MDKEQYLQGSLSAYRFDLLTESFATFDANHSKLMWEDKERCEWLYCTGL